MACRCPSEVFADIDTLPRGSLTVQKFSGACFDAVGDYLYGTATNPVGGTDHILRWPYPALNAYEVIVGPFVTSIQYPCVLGSNVFWLGGSTGRDIEWKPIDGSTGASTLVTLPPFASGQFYWGLRHQGGYLWIAYVQFITATTRRNGWLRIDPVTGTTTEFRFSDASASGHMFLSNGVETAVASDGALWAQFTIVTVGGTGLTRLDPDSGIYQTVGGSAYNFQPCHPVADGSVRAVALAPNPDVSYIVGPDMSLSADPCEPTVALADLRTRAFLAFNDSHTIVVFKPSAADDRLLELACPATSTVGWRINSLSIGGASVAL